MTNPRDTFFDLDIEIGTIIGNVSYGKDGLKTIGHLGKVNQKRVRTLRERRDVAFAAWKGA